jgi:uncharacterized protein (DUF1697 family)
MPAYIAMLRGINVSGHKPVKMDKLRASFEKLGFSNVSTYVQSGNVIFEAARGPEAQMQAKIEKQILADFGLSVPVVLRTAKELGEIIEHNPFARDASLDQSKFHVTFLSAPSPDKTRDLIFPLAVPGEQIHANGREIYLYCPHGYGISKLSNTAIEKKLALRATTRNWKTVNALLALTSQRR